MPKCKVLAFCTSAASWCATLDTSEHANHVLTGDTTTAETSDGTILFVFGDEAAAAAHQKESTPEPEPEPEEASEPEPEPAAQPDSKPAEPIVQLAAAAASPPAESPAAAAEEAEPEAAYEEARGTKVKEAVKEKPLKEGAETSGMHCTMPLSSILSMLSFAMTGISQS